jgi:hypothetical protein
MRWSKVKETFTNWEELDEWVSGTKLYALDDVVVIHNVVSGGSASIAYRCLAAHVAPGNSPTI